MEKLSIDRKKFIEILYAAALSGVAIYFDDYPYWIQAVVDWLQCGMIFVLLLLALHDEQKFGTDDDRGSKAVAQFLKYWKKLWLVWLFLYLIFATSDTFKAIHTAPPDSSVLQSSQVNDWQSFCEDLSNKTNPVAIFLMRKFGSDTNTLNEIIASGSATISQQEILLRRVNTIIAGNVLYRIDRFPNNMLGVETKRLTKKKWDGTEQAHENLLLLNDAFPQALSVNQPPNVPYWNTSLDLVANVANNIQSTYIFLLFLIMTKKTTEEKKGVVLLASQIIFSVIAALGLLELLFSVCAPSVFPAAGVTKADEVSTIAGITFSTISGLFAGVVFCLFFGRLGSHYIGLNPIWMASLYLYATIQPLYPLFRIFDAYSDESRGILESVQIGLKVLAAVLKLVLFLRVREIIKQPRLLFFMNRIARDDEKLAAEYKEFSEANAGRSNDENSRLGGA